MGSELCQRYKSMRLYAHDDSLIQEWIGQSQLDDGMTDDE